ncbi:hypothetical protein [Hymenobacter sp. UYAg731]
MDGRRVAVPCRYVLGPQRTVSFGLPKGYDHPPPFPNTFFFNQARTGSS